MARKLLPVLLCAAASCFMACNDANTTQPRPVGLGKSRSEGLERAIVLLIVNSRSTDAAVRANCIEALQPLQDSRVNDVIEQGLHDREWVVRYAATLAAGKRQSLKLKPQIQRMVKDDPNESVRVACVYALKRLGDPSHMNTLAEAIRSTDYRVRANTAFVLGLLGDKSAIGLLEQQAREPDARVKLEITAAMARLGDENAQNALLAMSLSKLAENRLVALATAGDVLKPERANVLSNGLKDPSPLVQLVAARTLGKMGSPLGHSVAYGYRNDSSAEIRALAAHALGDMLLPSEEGPLVRMLGDPELSVQLAAASGLVNVWSKADAR